MKKVLGLVLELNPYHNGHKYFIEKAKEIVKPDLTIGIISSSFMMRGDPMIMDKFSKTKILLNENIDLVVELPFISGVNNRDYFCNNSIEILKKFNITDLCFGAECENLNDLLNLVNLNYSDEFNNSIKKFLDKGFSYSTSANKAILELTNDINLSNSFSMPNNTLAIGYLNAIKDTKIIPHVIKRIDNNYFDEEINDYSFNSATAIRNELKDNKNISSFIPNYDYNFYNPLTLENNLYKLFQYKLLNPINTNIKGISEGIENRLLSFINEKNYNEFINSVVTKRYNLNKIKRLILYILLDIDKQYENNNFCYYLRVLGMNDIGKKHINSLNKDIKKEIITSFKNQDSELVNIELAATKLYGIITNNYDIYREEFNIPYRKEN